MKNQRNEEGERMDSQAKTTKKTEYKDLTDMIAEKSVTREELLKNPEYFADVFPYEDYFDFLAIAACVW